MHALSRFALIPALAITVLATAGCKSGPKPGEVRVGFEVIPSRTTILAGENVTFTANTTNTLNRDASIEWTTTGGKMEEVQGDRIRRITFDDAGEYKVSTDLLIEGKRVDTEITKIFVQEVR